MTRDYLLFTIEQPCDWHAVVGIFGARYTLECLDRMGRSDVAWKIATQTSYPSWGRMCRGRTTLSETWFARQTNNHIMFGSVDAWFYWTLGGIRVDESASGPDRLVLQPYFAPGLDRCRCVRPTIRGQVWSHWQRTGSYISWFIDIPAGAEARVVIPILPGTSVQDGEQVFWDRGLTQFIPGIRMAEHLSDGRLQLTVGSGRYDFRFVST
jgi:alpha-L-rhamnosidase